MKMFVRAVQFVELAMWPVLGCLVFLLFVFTSFGRREPKLTNIGPIILILGGTVLLWVGYIAWRCRFLRKMANPSVVDTSMSLVPLPDGLAGAAAELQRLGFTLLGQYTIATAWAEGPTRVYAMYVSPENPGLWAEISYTTSVTSFISYWANGAALETTYPALKGANVPGTFPDLILVQRSADGIEAARELHLATLDRYEPVGGTPLAVPDRATAVKLLIDGMNRIHEFHRAKLRFTVAPLLFVVPAWLGLAWFAVTG